MSLFVGASLFTLMFVLSLLSFFLWLGGTLRWRLGAAISFTLSVLCNAAAFWAWKQP